MKIQTVNVDVKKIQEFFNDAEYELKYENRFNNEKLNKIVEYMFLAEANKTITKKDTILYRARIYNESDAEYRYNNSSDNHFKGYNEIDSYVNLNKSVIVDGRCNPAGIIYLYASESVPCCIHEIRPSVGAYVSVASVKVCERLKILNLSTATIGIMKNTDDNILPDIDNGFLCQYLYELFKRPYQYKNDYLITQYVSEKLKIYGFDGIKYTSSLYSGEMNTNYAIFSYMKCRAIDSRLYKIVENQIMYE